MHRLTLPCEHGIETRSDVLELVENEKIVHERTSAGNLMSLTQAPVPVFGQGQEDRYIRHERTVDDYKQHTLQTQIYARPDTYIGSVDHESRGAWLFDTTTNRLGFATITMPEGIERCFLEIASNAGDNADASRRLGVSPGTIDVSIDANYVTIRNGGEPIPLIPHSSSTVDTPRYVPEFIFGVLLTSSNYDTKVIRMGVGRNGYGAKLVSIFSKYARFKVGDAKNGQEWEGVWTNNMTEKTFKITPGHQWDPARGWVLKGQPYTGPSYVEVTYMLDFQRFGLLQYPPEAVPIFARYTIDFGFACKLPVSFNGVQYNLQNIRDYAKLFWSQEQIDHSIVHYEWPITIPEAELAKMTKKDRDALVGVPPEGWDRMSKKQREAIIANPPTPDFIPVVEIMCIDTPDAGVCISFVNGMMTHEGGVHVNEAYSVIGAHFLEQFNKYTVVKKAAKASGKAAKGGKAAKSGKGKPKESGDAKPKKDSEDVSAKLTMADLKQHMSMIINCRLPDPKYKSQSKTYLTGPKPTINIDEDQLKPLGHWNLFDRLSASLDAKLYKSIKKDEKQRRGRVHLDKGVPANEAGGVNSSRCVLYIVEGKSASSYPKKRIAMTPGNKDYGGYYPIKGKFPNVLKMTPIAVANNKEIRDIKKMVNLREGVTYDDPADIATLYYGLIIITTDMDSDGTHIRMLLITFFLKYPGLVRRGMVCYLMTFAVRLFDGAGKCVGRFATEQEFAKWADANPGHKYKVKYYKGLGTSRDADIKDDLTSASLVVCLHDEEAPASISMAFGKDGADQRKKWIATWRDTVRTDDIIFVQASDLLKYRNITDIINKDLIDYTIDALFRAIPSEEDLIKKSQRQALYYVLEHWKYGHSRQGSMKVDRIAGAAAQLTKYHHGPKSMIDTMIRMCQSYVGSNNLAYLAQEGQMGTRDQGGEDAADARYSETMPEAWLSKAINEEMVDLVPKRIVDGEPAEPCFIPCDIPMGIINGFNGMATGHSTYSPPHSLYKTIIALYNMCMGQKVEPLQPYFHGFKGTVEVVDKAKGFQPPGAPLPTPGAVVAGGAGVMPIAIPATKSRLRKRAGDVEPAPPIPGEFKLPGEEPDREPESDDEDLGLPKPDDTEEPEHPDDEAPKEYKPPKKGRRTIVTRGIFTIDKMYDNGAADITVTELPIGRWMDDYQKWLCELEKLGDIAGFRDNSNTDDVVQYTIYQFKHKDGINHKTLKLQTSFGYNNITLINRQGHPHVYNTIDEVLKVYYDNMIGMYEQLRLSRIAKAEKDYIDCAYMMKFIHLVITGEIVVFKQKRDFVHQQMTKHEIPHEYYKKVKLHDCDEENLSHFASEMAKLQETIAYLKTLTPQGMWSVRLKDLYDFFVQSKYVE